MIQTEIIETIVNSIFGFQYLSDIVIGIVILVALILGFTRGLWKSLWNLVFFAITFALVLVFAMPKIGDFINEGIWVMTGLSLTMEFEGTPYVFSTLTDVIKGISSFAEAKGTLSAASRFADDAFLEALSMSLANAVGLFLVTIVTVLVSWLLGGLLWMIVWKPLIKKSAKKKDRKVKKIKLFGGLVGVVKGYLVALIFAVAISPLFATLGAVNNVDEAPYSVFNPIMVIASRGLDPHKSFLFSFVGVDNPASLFTAVSEFEHDGVTYQLFDELIEFVQNTDTPPAP